MTRRRCAALCRALSLLAAALVVVGPSTATAATAPDNAACGPSYHANATRQLQLAPKEGFGVIFVAHHGDPEKKQKFIAQAIESANSYRDASIELPRALITSDGGPPLPGARPRSARSGSAAACRGRVAVARLRGCVPCADGLPRASCARWSPV